MPERATAAALNRELLRQAGEHLGTLAEQERTRYEMGLPHRHNYTAVWNRYVRLAKLSREVLELANNDALAAALAAVSPAPEPVTSGDVIDAAYRLEKEIREHVPTFPLASHCVRDVLEKHLRRALLRAVPPAPHTFEPDVDYATCRVCGAFFAAHPGKGPTSSVTALPPTEPAPQETLDDYFQSHFGIPDPMPDPPAEPDPVEQFLGMTRADRGAAMRAQPILLETAESLLRQCVRAGDEKGAVALFFRVVFERTDIMHARAQQAESRAIKAEALVDRYCPARQAQS